MDFEILIIGTDINAYTMARNCHELYHKKIHLIGKEKMSFTADSLITDIEYVDNLWDSSVFKETLKNYALKQDKKILLIATNDFYVRLIAENKEYLEKWYIFNYPRLDIVDTFLVKDKFYTAYKDVLNVPKTYIYSCKQDELNIDLDYPLVLKPSDGVLYYKHKFAGQSKVYKIKSKEELDTVISDIKKSGYDGNLIIQEFIEGDDSRLFDCMMYLNSEGKAEFSTFAQIGLQERTNTGVGNCTVLINGYSEFGNYDDVVLELKNFLESINYTGVAEFDLKYDSKTNSYKVFEINPRQARCSYYLTALGYNPIKYLVDDLVYNKRNEFVLVKEQVLLTFVPKLVIKKYIDNEQFKQLAFKLIKENKVTNPLRYSKDKSFKRTRYLFLRDLNYIKKYKKNRW